jgi:tRNA 2-thiouridine synthesizing protein A
MRRRGQLVSAAGAARVETLDLAGEVCPYTFVRTKLRLEELPVGAELHILVDHAPAAENVPRSLVAEGQAVVSIAREGVAEGAAQGARWRIVVIKRCEPRLVAKRRIDAMKTE